MYSNIIISFVPIYNESIVQYVFFIVDYASFMELGSCDSALYIKLDNMFA